MCIIFLAYKKHPQYKLILAGNRDEFYGRPTESARFWDDYHNVLAGRDLEKLGTWLGITKNGRFAAITNYRDHKLLVENPISRGNIIKDYLTAELSPEEYLERIKDKRSLYNPFNVLVGNLEELYYYSNVENKIRELSSGIYGLSNALLDTLWPKVVRGKKRFSEVVDKDKRISIEGIFDVLSDRNMPIEDDLPETGMGKEWERILSPVFIRSDAYGTRSSTVLMMDYNNKVTFIEKSLVDAKANLWDKKEYKFKIS